MLAFILDNHREYIEKAITLYMLALGAANTISSFKILCNTIIFLVLRVESVRERLNYTFVQLDTTIFFQIFETAYFYL